MLFAVAELLVRDCDGDFSHHCELTSFITGAVRHLVFDRKWN